MTSVSEQFTVIYRAWAPRIFNHFRRLTWDRDEASDLTSEVFLAAWDRREQLNDTERVGGWLWTIAGRMAANRVRNETRRKARDAESVLAQNRSSEAPPSTRQRLSRAFAALDEKDRQLLLWREYSGMSYAEIAPLAGQSVEGVRSALYRAREKLRDEFNKRWE